MTYIFGRNPSELCLIYNSLVNKSYGQYYHRQNSWNQLLLASQQLQLHAVVINEKELSLESYFGLVDGTIY